MDGLLAADILARMRAGETLISSQGRDRRAG